MTFRLAMVQMRVAGGEKQRNLAHAEEMIAEAAGNGAKLVLLPETMDLGWTDPSARNQAEPVPDGEPTRRLIQAVQRHRVLVCAGLTERDGERVYNSAVIIDRNGQLLCRHRKLNELNIGHEYYNQGDRLNVVHTELGTLGLMICADGSTRDRVLSRALCYMGADVILSPCAWAMPSDHDNSKQPYGDTWRHAYQPVAKEFCVWIAGASNVGHIPAGPWAGRNCIGCSLLIGPDGEEILQGPYGADAETILYADIAPRERPARGCGWNQHWQRQRP